MPHVMIFPDENIDFDFAEFFDDDFEEQIDDISYQFVPQIQRARELRRLKKMIRRLRRIEMNTVFEYPHEEDDSAERIERLDDLRERIRYGAIETYGEFDDAWDLLDALEDEQNYAMAPAREAEFFRAVAEEFGVLMEL